MFTGLVRDMGKLISFEPHRQGDDEVYHAGIVTNLPKQDLTIGASVACNGMCLTVIDCKDTSAQKDFAHFFHVALSPETLDRTNARRWSLGDVVNLEPSLRVGDMLGGHYVSGHIDDTARVIDIQPYHSGRYVSLCFDKKYRQFIAEKGSITLDGISLTVNTVCNDVLTLVVIQHTLDVTSWSYLAVDDYVNMEIDILARYIVNSQSMIGSS